MGKVIIYMFGSQNENVNDGKDAKMEVEIAGKIYDVTNFKHPGGSIIKYMIGQDASDAFDAFHDRSSKALKYLESLPKRTGTLPTTKSKDAFVRDFEELRNTLRVQGFFDPSPAEIIYRTSELIAIFGGGFYLLHLGWYYSGLLLLGIAQGRCGWYMHEGGHYSLTSNIKIDRIIQIIAYNIGSGMSASWWRNQHNKHHATPQKLQHDVDLNTLPLLAFHKLIGKNGNRYWLRFQSVLFIFPIALLTSLGWAFYLHPRYVIRTKQYGEILAWLVRYSFIAWLASQYGFLPVLKGFLFTYWVAGAYIFTLFAVSHTHKDVLLEDQHTDWARYGVLYTTNITPSPFVNWLMGYLNFQIEHHLFPSMPQFRHPLVSPMVKKLCEKHNVPYDVRTLPQALHDTFSNLNNVGIDAFMSNHSDSNSKRGSSSRVNDSKKAK